MKTLNEQENKIGDVSELDIFLKDHREDLQDLVRHKEGILELAKDIKNISSFVRSVKNKKSHPIFGYITDKEYVIVGVVIIAIVAIFKLTNPTILLTSVVSGLFGIGTGRIMRD